MGKKNKKREIVENKSQNPASPSGNSNFHAPGSSHQYSNEPIWYKLTVFIITTATLIWLAYLMQGWVLSLLASNSVVSRISKIISSIRGKDP